MRVVIVGAGAAGVFTAYRLWELYKDDPTTDYEITLLEADGRVGGNTYSVPLKINGRRYSIDCGAQFFHRLPQPNYVDLLEELGLTGRHGKIEARATGITIWDAQKDERRLWLPDKVGDVVVDFDGEDRKRFRKFAVFMGYSYLLDRDPAQNWTLSVDDWLDDMPLGEGFKQNVIKPFLYQFVTLPADRIGEASALYAATYFARNGFGEPAGRAPKIRINNPPGIQTYEVYQSRVGLDGVLKKALARAGIEASLSEPVDAVRQLADGNLEVVTTKRTIPADHVVMACDPESSARILAHGGWPDTPLIQSLFSLEYQVLDIAMQNGGSPWKPTDRAYREAVNTIVDGDQLIFSAWFGPLRQRDGNGDMIKVYKSWATPNLDASRSRHTFLTHQHQILYPTTTFMAERAKVDAKQGEAGLWFAGGWTNWFDSQEASLDSAGRIALEMPGRPARTKWSGNWQHLDKSLKLRRRKNQIIAMIRKAKRHEDDPNDRRELDALINEMKAID